ncbi:tetraacyldisaccharide 4'-kinase [Gimesia aquarii]|uniref:Tetraacyldisaccharide 4'-kinase n=1 Tax=Gimesia aquarii TaxID=2527964 RepID=A0A517W3D9_9PLAN|nr:tetraacyldisaccharide 4'-kinase [Gimesia aquarii]QDT99740.1 Tetraacyldisaccharide 4'-kinase [Gimesia aquarii]
MNEVEYLRIISGQKTDLRAQFLKPCLWLLSLPYYIIVLIRNWMFDRHWRSVKNAAVPVISLGNLTTGGTGKTPLVAYLTQWFQKQDINVALLSRGYRSLPGEVNDEKLLLDRLCPGVPHYQNPNRCASAVKAVEAGAQLLILDDGFQHRKIARNLNIVLIDSLCPWGYGYLLPRGLLREPKSALKRADLVILTRTDQCSQAELENLTSEVEKQVPRNLIVHAEFRPQYLVNAHGETQLLESVAGKTVVSFCAIGNPEGFKQTLKRAGFQVAGMEVFPDHHHYSQAELNTIGTHATAASADLILTTCKDLVKMSEHKLAGVPVWAVEIGVEITAGREDYQEILQNLANQVSSC